MNTLQKMSIWAYAHHPFWMDFIRIVLGGFILYKGIYFIQNNEALISLMKTPNSWIATYVVAHYVSFSHIVGGFLIAIGLLTRIAIVFQLPVLVGAVFYVNLSSGLFDSELWISLIVLGLLIVFLFFGPGKISVDEYTTKDEEAFH